MRPSVQSLGRALRLVGDVLGESETTYCFDGRFAFGLDFGWRLVVSADDAERYRVEACREGLVRATMWCLAHDHERLAELAWAARNEAAAIAA